MNSYLFFRPSTVFAFGNSSIGSHDESLALLRGGDSGCHHEIGMASSPFSGRLGAILM